MLYLFQNKLVVSMFWIIITTLEFRVILANKRWQVGILIKKIMKCAEFPQVFLKMFSEVFWWRCFRVEDQTQLELRLKEMAKRLKKFVQKRKNDIKSFKSHN